MPGLSGLRVPNLRTRRLLGDKGKSAIDYQVVDAAAWEGNLKSPGDSGLHRGQYPALFRGQGRVLRVRQGLGHAM